MNGHEHDDECACSEDAMERLDRAGINYERVSLREALESDLPLFFMPRIT